MDRHRVVIVGAGYAGLTAARTVAARTRSDRVEVVLVNARDHFVERVRLHQVASGQPVPGRPLADLLEGTGITLVVARVERIDTGTRTVHADAAGQAITVGYDTLVHALGSGAADTAGVPGAAEHARTLADLASARETAALLASEAATAERSVVVVGGGLTGIEAAAELAETRPGARVRLVTRGEAGTGLSPRGRRHLRRTLDRLGVRLHERVGVTEVRSDGVRLDDGTVLHADAVVWNTGFRVPDLAREAGITVDSHGRVVVDATLRSVSHPDVYAVGDAARAPGPGGRELRMACATGLPMGAAAGRAVAERLAGRPAPPLRFRYRIQCVSLGRRDGLVQFVGADDTPHAAVLTGRPAALVKEAVVRGAALFAQRLSGLPARRRRPVTHGRGATAAV
ncbi:FAD-dependent oxidoreductase [Thermobifida halotolerans]|uniref:FAD-dependent oxidoreductase n=1 Tax=Thermobifida halotolerans TaxID=483545 RepID=A0AA97LZM4_9ACTN|nr:FAD-dependent oxidoreductase [Thermobifida halotolerans]UOE20904.1 FAD-dependent oxidoreductase [Thermobifida halotolerans]